MKVTYNCIRSYVKLHVDLDILTKTLSSIGLEVEEVLDKEKIYSQFIIAEIIEAVRHPNADKLMVCKVSNGDEQFQIVCGAANARAGIKVVMAPVSAIIPQNNMKIRASKIRDIESFGMLCSESELLLGKDSDGIIEIADKDARIGMNFANFMNMNDKVIDIALTPNRGDCASVYGIARDIAASGIGEVSAKFHDFYKNVFDFKKHPLQLSVSIKCKNICQEIAFCHIKNVDNKLVSNKKIKTIFNLLGAKSHTALVDISNFAMYEYGRPNHIYDADKIDGSIVLRLSQDGEKFTSLEDKDYSLPDGILVVADDKKVLSIAGVIGGYSSKVDKNTKNILVEVGNFQQEQVVKSARLLNIKTDSSFRFERRIDYGNTSCFMHYITKLIQEICGGEIDGSTIIKGTESNYIKQISLDYADIEKILGIKIDPKDAEETLNRLGFVKIKGSDDISIPTWRQGDIVDYADIAEEIIRMKGIERSEQIDFLYSAKNLQEKQIDFSELFRNVLVGKNINEVILWSFISQKHAELFRDKCLVKLANPISSEFAVMRSSMLPGLLQAVQSNMARGAKNLSFFEIGRIFQKTESDDVIEEECLSIIRVGNAVQKSPLSPQRKFDFYDVKDDLYALVNEINIDDDNLLITKESMQYYHLGKSAAFYIGKKLIAYAGELHPKIANEFGIKDRVYCLEVFYDRLPQKNIDKRKSLFLSDLQSVTRDFAFFIDSNIQSREITKSIRSLKSDLIDGINIFDVYDGPNIEMEKKSVAFNVRLQPKDKTLVEKDIEDISNRIIAIITDKLGGQLRSIDKSG
jgi:phenylalanyl-tRNA synthetase beta chain